ncbi:MAG: hypothetical protein ACM3SR_06390, partial [Ignavibacteriales bacterium]
MSNDKYIGLDVHQSSVVTAVHNHQGKCVIESIIETKTQTIRDFIKSISGTAHVAFEEGTQAAWLYHLPMCGGAAAWTGIEVAPWVSRRNFRAGS